MEKHITLVGILNIVYESLGIIGSFVLFAIAIGFRYFFELISRFDHHGMDEVPPEVMDIVPFILTVIGIWVLLNDETIRLFNPVLNAPVEKSTISS